MSINEQAFLSGLVFADDKDKLQPQWRPSTWPPLLGGHRSGHASVVVQPSSLNREEVLVVMGGRFQNSGRTDSVIHLNIESKKWQEGPALNDKRSLLASVVCNGVVYVIGGANESSDLDTIESLAVKDLLTSSSPSNIHKKGWTTLDCRLSTRRYGCAAAVVHDRFIVVAGGYNGSDVVSSVDIINTSCGNPCSVIPGPPLIQARYCFGMAVICQRIYVVGGRSSRHCLSSIEYLELDDLFDNTATSWTTHERLSLGTPRYGHAVVQVGFFLVVAGGLTTYPNTCASVEVLDTAKTMVLWKIPHMTDMRYKFSMVSWSNGIAAIGGSSNRSNTCETLSLVGKNHALFARLLAIGKIPT